MAMRQLAKEWESELEPGTTGKRENASLSTHRRVFEFQIQLIKIYAAQLGTKKPQQMGWFLDEVR